MRTVLLTVLTGGLAVIGLSLTACTETALEPQEAASLAATPGADLVLDTEVIQSVTGNGHVIDNIEPARDRTVTFNILKHADGSVDGWYHAIGRGPGGANTRVRVECLHVVGNKAWATGTVVAAIDPGNIGRPYSMLFIDNGEGANASADEVGLARFVYYDCATEPTLPETQVLIGNLQVRG